MIYCGYNADIVVLSVSCVHLNKTKSINKEYGPFQKKNSPLVVNLLI